MDKENLIISIIIVLCVAAAVAAYGIINQGPLLSDFTSMTSGSGSGGNNIGNNTNNTGTGTSGGSGSSDGSGSGSGGGSGSGSGSGGSGGGGSGGGTIHSISQIRSIAANANHYPGTYLGTPSYRNGYWYVTIYNSTDDSVVDGMSINDRNGHIDRA